MRETGKIQSNMPILVTNRNGLFNNNLTVSKWADINKVFNNYLNI